MKRKSLLLTALLLAAFSCKNERAAPPPDATDTAASISSGVERARNVAPAAQAPSPPGTPAPAPGIPRMVIRNAQLTLVVRDAAAAADRLTSLAASAGGYIADAKQWRDSDQLRATLTLRIPAQRLDDTLAAARKLASRVDNENIDSNDVTQEYVDLESQVRNLEAAEVEMRQLMTTVRQRMQKAQDILEVYQHLTELRGQIEQAKGRMRYLSQMAAMATIKVDLVPDAIVKPVVTAGWQPVAIARNASRMLVGTLQGLATAAIWVTIYLLPVALLFVLGAMAIRALARAVRRRMNA